MYMHIGACITLAMPNGERIRWLCKAVEAERSDGDSCIESKEELLELLRENTPKVASIAFVPENLISLLKTALADDDDDAEQDDRMDTD
ncbi:hypothetical protein [Bifidobacterium callitrichidarum]|uniref:Uncharacterized protein n=1 Tax=Bifidobacterium callitrichidarum TaxID=2052941 RepID=A0A2U2ND51_9BIFI|nr:hypothetical protein [Bifidobacterium callitrichidarum]PWG67030.1 hypothetical protein DF196_00505 [Bifidobacterium callitrichidarum]